MHDETLPSTDETVATDTATATVSEPETTAEPMTVTAPVVTTSLTNQQITECLAHFKTLLSSAVLTPSIQSKAASYLSQATLILIKDPSTQNLDTVWNFHVDNKNGVMQERTALVGLNTLTTNGVGHITAMIYSAFRHYVTKDKAKIDLVLLNRTTKSTALSNYLSSHH